MEWFIIALVVMGVLGAIGNKNELEEQKAKKKRHDLEIVARKHKAKQSRDAILASGNQELIGRLRLMEAGYDARMSDATSVNITSPSGSSALQTAAAVAGGMVVGNAISGAIATAQLESAMADISADLKADLAQASAELDGALAEIETHDFDFDI